MWLYFEPRWASLSVMNGSCPLFVILMSWSLDVPLFNGSSPWMSLGNYRWLETRLKRLPSPFPWFWWHFSLKHWFQAFLFRNEIGKLRIAADSRQRSSDEQKMQYASQLARTNKHQVIFVIQIQIKYKYKYGFKYVQCVPRPTKTTWISLFQISNVFLPFFKFFTHKSLFLNFQYIFSLFQIFNVFFTGGLLCEPTAGRARHSPQDWDWAIQLPEAGGIYLGCNICICILGIVPCWPWTTHIYGHTCLLTK